jgi:hypothetical protein
MYINKHSIPQAKQKLERKLLLQDMQAAKQTGKIANFLTTYFRMVDCSDEESRAAFAMNVYQKHLASHHVSTYMLAKFYEEHVPDDERER